MQSNNPENQEQVQDRQSTVVQDNEKKINPKVMAIFGGLLFFIVIYFVVFSDNGENKPQLSDKATAVQSNVPPMPKMPELKKPKEVKKVDVLPPPPRQAVDKNGKKELTPEERKLLSNNLITIQQGSQGGSSDDGMNKIRTRKQVETVDENGNVRTSFQPSDLDQATTATAFAPSSARVLKNRHLLMTQGQFLDCVLETAIDSTLSGMVRAVLSKDAYSSDGKVILLDKGTRLIGQYQKGMQQGQARLFVLWTRAETPSGVIITLDSPGADQLGRSGMDGYVDTHFWERFGAAIMFSMIDDVGNFLLDRLSNYSNENQTVNFESTGETGKTAASIILEKSINIPPTLHKNQGDMISIFIARDLDFSTVYDLKQE